MDALAALAGIRAANRAEWELERGLMPEEPALLAPGAAARLLGEACFRGHVRDAKRAVRHGAAPKTSHFEHRVNYSQCND